MATDSTGELAAVRQETPAEMVARLYASLPPLNSDDFYQLVLNGREADLPAEVLVRALRELRVGRTADAILTRLLSMATQYSYMRPLRGLARRRVQKSDWFDADYLFGQAVTTVGLALLGPQGAGADTAWIAFLAQRLEDAYRELNGRRDERADRDRVDAKIDPESGELHDPVDGPDAQPAPWHGRVAPDLVEWLEAFITRTVATIRDDRIRQVALDLFSAEPTKIDGTGGLAERYGVTRDTIIRWRDAARAKVLAALSTQNEREIDVGWLERRFKPPSQGGT